ncbi:hypothetical protein EDC01DRAFT_375389 [Geopyxis carbonaria]|nr:hypothetical protein EDC01DRAFT_375389 [Geopyxis carbonaria]
MGVCQSCIDNCLGNRGKESHERDRLLADTSNGNYGNYMHYPPSPTTAAAHDPQQQLHEREYLERLVAQTSENLIDIFAPPMLASAPTTMSITPTMRGDWYRNLLERTSPPGLGMEVPIVLDPKAVGEEERIWLESIVRKGEEAVREIGRVKEVGALVIDLDMDL